MSALRGTLTDEEIQVFEGWENKTRSSWPVVDGCAKNDDLLQVALDLNECGRYEIFGDWTTDAGSWQFGSEEDGRKS